jgi:hypothetical protein
VRVRVTRGRCYDHNFLRFLPFGEKIGVFLKNQCYDQNFAQFTFVLSQKRQFFSLNFSAKIFFKNHNIGPRWVWEKVAQNIAKLISSKLQHNLTMVKICDISAILRTLPPVNNCPIRPIWSPCREWTLQGLFQLFVHSLQILSRKKEESAIPSIAFRIGSRVARFFLVQNTKKEKIYQITSNYTKCP